MPPSIQMNCSYIAFSNFHPASSNLVLVKNQLISILREGFPSNKLHSHISNCPLYSETSLLPNDIPRSSISANDAPPFSVTKVHAGHEFSPNCSSIVSIPADWSANASPDKIHPFSTATGVVSQSCAAVMRPADVSSPAGSIDQSVPRPTYPFSGSRNEQFSKCIVSDTSSWNTKSVQVSPSSFETWSVGVSPQNAPQTFRFRLRKHFVLRNHISLTVYRFRFFQLLVVKPLATHVSPTVICQHRSFFPWNNNRSASLFSVWPTSAFSSAGHRYIRSSLPSLSSTVSQEITTCELPSLAPSCSLLIFFLCQHGKIRFRLFRSITTSTSWSRLSDCIPRHICQNPTPSSAPLGGSIFILAVQIIHFCIRVILSRKRLTFTFFCFTKLSFSAVIPCNKYLSCIHLIRQILEY